MVCDVNKMLANTFAGISTVVVIIIYLVHKFDLIPSECKVRLYVITKIFPHTSVPAYFEVDTIIIDNT